MADESGALALVMALALVAFLGMAALAVDYGYMCVVQGELEKAAEAGALAGANALGSASNPNWSGGQTGGHYGGSAKSGRRTDFDRCPGAIWLLECLNSYLTGVWNYPASHGFPGYPGGGGQEFRSKRRFSAIVLRSSFGGKHR